MRCLGLADLLNRVVSSHNHAVIQPAPSRSTADAFDYVLQK